MLLGCILMQPTEDDVPSLTWQVKGAFSVYCRWPFEGKRMILHCFSICFVT